MDRDRPRDRLRDRLPGALLLLLALLLRAPVPGSAQAGEHRDQHRERHPRRSRQDRGNWGCAAGAGTGRRSEVPGRATVVGVLAGTGTLGGLGGPVVAMPSLCDPGFSGRPGPPAPVPSAATGGIPTAPGPAKPPRAVGRSVASAGPGLGVPPRAEAPAPPAAAGVDFRLREREPPGAVGPPGVPSEGSRSSPAPRPVPGAAGAAPGRAGLTRRLFFNPTRKNTGGGGTRRCGRVTRDVRGHPARCGDTRWHRAGWEGTLCTSGFHTWRSHRSGTGTPLPPTLPHEPPSLSPSPPSAPLFGDSIRPPAHSPALCGGREVGAAPPPHCCAPPHPPGAIPGGGGRGAAVTCGR